MALTEAQLQELAELEELEALEQMRSKTPTRFPSAPAPSQDMSSLTSAAIGAGQGVTFDFGDEILAALQAPFSDKTYRELQKENEAVATQAAEQNPLSYYAGNIGAGVAFNPAGKVVGAAVKGIGSTAARTAPALAKVAEEAPAVGRIAQMGTEGAIYGGLLGAGQATSEQSLVDSIVDGAQSGAVVGTALGGAIQGAKALLPSAQRFKDVNIIKTVEDIIDLKKKGFDPTAPGALAKVDDEILKDVGEFIRGSGAKGVSASSLPDLRMDLGRNLGEIRQQALRELGDSIPIKLDPIEVEAMLSYRAPTESPITLGEDLPKLTKFLRTWGIIGNQGTVPGELVLPPEKAGAFLSDVNEILSQKKSGYMFSGPSSKQILEDLQEAVNSQVETAISASGRYPQYDKAKKAFRAVAVTQDALGLPKGYFNNDKQYFLDQERIANKIKLLSRETSMTGEAFNTKVKHLRDIVEDKGFELLPQEAQVKVKDLLEKINKFEDLSRSRELATVAQGEAGFQESGKFGLFNSAKALLLKSVGSIIDTPQAARQAAEETISRPGAEGLKKGLVAIKNVGDIDFYFNKLTKIAQEKGQPELARTLENIGKQDMKKRRALLYVLMQQPSIRKIMEEENTPATP